MLNLAINDIIFYKANADAIKANFAPTSRTTFPKRSIEVISIKNTKIQITFRVINKIINKLNLFLNPNIHKISYIIIDTL